MGALATSPASFAPSAYEHQKSCSIRTSASSKLLVLLGAHALASRLLIAHPYTTVLETLADQSTARVDTGFKYEARPTAARGKNRKVIQRFDGPVDASRAIQVSTEAIETQHDDSCGYANEADDVASLGGCGTDMEAGT